VHHAAQFGTALGISCLEHQPDDSHTNLGWDDTLGALVSRPVATENGSIAVGVRLQDLSIVAVVDGAMASATPLHGMTIADTMEAVRSIVAARGLDPARYTLNRHYEIPRHRVDDGGTFDTSATAAFIELDTWYRTAARELEHVTRQNRGASEVRTWPHHFDIATLIEVGRDRFTGAGLSPGDDSYSEPYFYVNATPQPALARVGAPLAGGGVWHTREWIGAVLPGSRLTSVPAAQQDQVRAFLDSAIAACRALVGG